MADLLEVARVVSVHGLRGALKVLPHWPGSTALSGAAALELVLPNGQRLQHRVESCTGSGKGFLLKLSGVDTREAAEALRGARIEVERAALEAQAAPGQSGPYLVDLIGASIETPSGLLGRAVEVVVNPTVDSLIVERPDGSRVELVLRPEYIESIDATRIVLATEDGILA
jgi:16S rRNA processing protein RimM